MGDDSPLSERERVVDWRELELLDAGYPPQLARLIAKRMDIDLHRACDLAASVRAKGLDATVAAEILL